MQHLVVTTDWPTGCHVSCVPIEHAGLGEHHTHAAAKAQHCQLQLPLTCSCGSSMIVMWAAGTCSDLHIATRCQRCFAGEEARGRSCCCQPVGGSLTLLFLSLLTCSARAASSSSFSRTRPSPAPFPVTGSCGSWERSTHNTQLLVLL